MTSTEPRFLAPGLARADRARRGAFSSDLSPAAAAVARAAGARPIVQVMGACTYRIAVSGAPVLGDPGYRAFYARQPVLFEVRRIASAYNAARQTALTRMTAQAARAGADLVLDVKIRLTEHESEEMRTVEYLATGSAVRMTDSAPAAAPALAALPAADLYALRAAGYEPVGIAAATSIVYVRPTAATGRAMSRRRWRAPLNQELPDYTAAATAARAACDAQMREQAIGHGGSGIVAVRLDLTHSLGADTHSQPPPYGPTPRRSDLHVTVHGLGTVVRARSRSATTQSEPIPVLWLS